MLVEHRLKAMPNVDIQTLVYLQRKHKIIAEKGHCSLYAANVQIAIFSFRVHLCEWKIYI